jgi:predicted dehydrogenase
MCRHCVAREELQKRIQDGAIGDVVLMRAYRMHGPIAFFLSPPKPSGISELLYQVQRFHSFLWASGGCYSDFLIHNIDECCMMKGAWPVRARASGGRHFRGNSIDQNFDTYSVEYTFADGSKLQLEGRCMEKCEQQFASYVHGSKGSAMISLNGHGQACSTFKGQQVRNPKEQLWKWGENEPNPYQTEWDRLIQAIRNDKPHNEVKRGAEASLVTAMGRMAAHTGQEVTFDQALNNTQELAPEVDTLTMDSPAPLKAGKDGKYPVPQPGKNGRREF